MFVMLKSGVMLTIHYNLVTYTRVIKVNLIIINNIDQKFKKKGDSKYHVTLDV